MNLKGIYYNIYNTNIVNILRSLLVIFALRFFISCYIVIVLLGSRAGDGQCGQWSP
jgi:hypothetical protein